MKFSIKMIKYSTIQWKDIISIDKKLKIFVFPIKNLSTYFFQNLINHMIGKNELFYFHCSLVIFLRILIFKANFEAKVRNQTKSSTNEKAQLEIH